LISTIIRIYHGGDEKDPRLIGVVEPVTHDERLAFQDKDELWEILKMLFNEEETDQLID
jgi:hypothetical protein